MRKPSMPKWLSKLGSSDDTMGWGDTEVPDAGPELDIISNPSLATGNRRKVSIISFLFFALVSFTLCYSQFGIIAFDNQMLGVVNLMLFMAPVALCICLIGALPGILLAILTGFLIMFRCQWTPTTAYDSHLSDPFLSVLSLVVGAVLMALVVRWASKRWPYNLSSGIKPWQRLSKQRIIATIAGCYLLCFIFSYGTRGLVYLFVPTGGAEYGYASIVEGYLESTKDPLVFLEAILNSNVFSIACLSTLWYVATRLSGTWKSGLTSMFNRYFASAMLIVFLVASSVSFCVETAVAMGEADRMVQEELQYINQQVITRNKTGAPEESIAEGYSTAYEGEVFVVHNGVVVSSNDPETVGESALSLLGASDMDNFDFLFGMTCNQMMIGYEDTTNEHLGMRGLESEGGYKILISCPLTSVFKARTATLAYSATFMFVLEIVVFLLAHWLLRSIVVKPIRRTNHTLSEITDGDLTRRVDERVVREFDSLSTGINTTVEALGDTISEVEQRNARDLATAKTIQESALPRTFPPFPEIEVFDIYASMNAAKEVGGDFYDFFLIDERTLGFVIADVSGKGIPGALFMMAAKTEIENYMITGMDLAQAILSANRDLCANNDAGMFVTVWAATLDWETGELTYVNAGHNPPLLRHGGEWEWLTKRGGLFLGTFDMAKYRSSSLTLEQGDQLLLYTDGVNEAFSIEEEEYGNDRLEAFLGEHADLHPRELVRALRADVAEWAEGAEQSDDITILSLEYGGVAEHYEQLVVPAEIGQLVQVYALIHDVLKRHGAPKSASHAIDVAIEELFCNVCNYAYPDATPENPGEVRIDLYFDEDGPALVMTMEDDGVPFDPLAKPDVEVARFIDDMPVGGLGIHMAKRLLDDMQYERRGDTNVLIMRKAW